METVAAAGGRAGDIANGSGDRLDNEAGNAVTRVDRAGRGTGDVADVAGHTDVGAPVDAVTSQGCSNDLGDAGLGTDVEAVDAVAALNSRGRDDPNTAGGSDAGVACNTACETRRGDIADVARCADENGIIDSDGRDGCRRDVADGGSNENQAVDRTATTSAVGGDVEETDRADRLDRNGTKGCVARGGSTDARNVPSGIDYSTIRNGLVARQIRDIDDTDARCALGNERTGELAGDDGDIANTVRGEEGSSDVAAADADFGEVAGRDGCAEIAVDDVDDANGSADENIRLCGQIHAAQRDGIDVGAGDDGRLIENGIGPDVADFAIGFEQRACAQSAPACHGDTGEVATLGNQRSGEIAADDDGISGSSTKAGDAIASEEVAVALALEGQVEVAAHVDDALESIGGKGEIARGGDAGAIGPAFANHHVAQKGTGSAQRDLPFEAAIRAGETPDATIVRGDGAEEVVTEESRL